MTDAISKNKSETSHVNVGAQQVATVYAKALLGAAETAGKLEAVVEQFDTLVADVLDRYPRLEEVLGSRLISDDDKVKLLDRVFGKQFEPLFLDFLKVVARHGRLDVLRPIRRELCKGFDDLRRRVRVRVVTATVPNSELSKKLIGTLAAMLDGDPIVEASVDPDLLGGVVLRIGDTVYDGSVAQEFQRLREQMIQRSVHEIQSGRDRFRHPGGN